MANFKKGIALALVATTAFTFAPVSTLGIPNAVVAEAAADATVTANDNGTYTGVDADNGAKTVTLPDAGKYYVLASGTATKFAVTATGAAVTGNTSTNGITDTTVDTEGKVKKLTVTATATNRTVGIVPNAATQPGTTTLTITKADTNQTIATIDYKVNDKSAFNFATGTTFAGKKNTNALGKYYVLAGADSTFTETDAAIGGDISTKWDNAAYTYVPTNVVEYSTDAPGVVNVQKTATGVKFTTGTAGTANVTILVKTSATDGNEVAKVVIPFTVEQSRSNITKVTYSSVKTNNHNVIFGGTAAYSLSGEVATDYAADGTKWNVTPPTPAHTLGTDSATVIALDTLVVKSAQVNVTAKTGVATFSTNNSKVATVDANGVITAVGKGNAEITAEVAQNDTYARQIVTIPVAVSDATNDVISVKVDGKTADWRHPVDLDMSTSTAANAVKTAQLVPTSAAGNTDFFYALYKTASVNADGTYTLSNAVAGNGDDVMSVNAAGQVSAGTVKADTTYYVAVSTKKNGNIDAGLTVVPVKVNTLPADTIDLQDTLTLDLTNNTSATLNPVAGNGASAVFTYTEDPDTDKGQTANVVRVSGKNVYASTLGVTRVKVTEVATPKTRETSTYVTVSVVSSAEKKASDLKVANSAIVLEAGKTATLGATATNAITYTSSDESVVTVVDGTVTAVKAGTANITVTAAASDTMDAATVTVPVVVTTPAKPVVVAKPAKVTGVKVTNVKGAKVKVSFKKDAKAAGYVVTYKVGKKTYKKTTASTSVKLSVKKGAKVKVTVKAFNYKDGNVKQYGKASKAVSKKTDKK